MDMLLFILSGAAVGLAIGLTGVGGGSLMTPLLIMFGIPYNVAIGTDLLYAAITKAGGVITHQRQATIRWDIVIAMSAGSLPAAVVTGICLSLFFDGSNDYQELLTHSLGVMLILTSIVLLSKQKIQNFAAKSPNRQLTPKQAKTVTFFMGISLGVLVTLSSVGAGAFGTAVLMLLYPKLLGLKIVGTDLAHAVPLTFIAGMSHLLFLDNVDFMLLFSLLIGSLPAIFIGTKIASRLPDRVMRPTLASVLMLMGVKFAFF